jgi:hypothetical protein
MQSSDLSTVVLLYLGAGCRPAISAMFGHWALKLLVKLITNELPVWTWRGNEHIPFCTDEPHRALAVRWFCFGAIGSWLIR